MPPKTKSTSGNRRPLTAAVPASQIPKKRTYTTLADKLSILKYVDDHPHLSQKEVALHFQQNGFPTISQPTIGRIVGAREELEKDAEDSGNLTYKRQRLVEYPEVEAALKEWVLQAQVKGIKITGDILREKARRFAQIQGLDMKGFLSLSNGWLDSFKSRHSLKQYRFHGEAGSVEEDDVQAARIKLRKITDQYAPKDILNMDETGLNDRMPPDRGLATAQFSGKKADKHRLTYALTTNADGSDTFPPLVIGHAQRPRCFQKKSGNDLGFDYWWNKKAWMTGSIFQGFLKNLNTRMRAEGRKVLLLVDNAPSHIFDAGTLTNVRVEFLPPNMTSRIQPMDGGIIRAFKAHYKRLFCKRAIDRDEAGEVDLYKIDQLQAMRLAQEAWDSVTKNTVINVWKHVGILSPRDSKGVVIKEVEEAPAPSESSETASDPDTQRAVAQLDETIKELATNSIAKSHVMSAEEMLGMEDGETEGTMDDEEIMEQVLENRRTAEDEESICEDEIEETLEPTISVAEGVRYLRELNRLFDSKPGPEFRDASRLIPKLIKSLNLDVQGAKKQKTITEFFVLSNNSRK